jgi:hypothetical protein
MEVIKHGGETVFPAETFPTSVTERPVTVGVPNVIVGTPHEGNCVEVRVTDTDAEALLPFDATMVIVIVYVPREP